MYDIRCRVCMKPAGWACDKILVKEVRTLVQLCIHQCRGIHRPVSVQFLVLDPQLFSEEASHLRFT